MGPIVRIKVGDLKVDTTGHLVHSLELRAMAGPLLVHCLQAASGSQPLLLASADWR